MSIDETNDAQWQSGDNQKCRGVIVVDTCDLETLSIPYHGVQLNSPLSRLALAKKDTGSYLDLLTLLAQHGFRVIVPEMVSFESADMLADGTNIRDAYAPTNRAALPYPTQEKAVKFCEGILGKDDKTPYNNMEIRPAGSGVSIYQTLLGLLREASILLAGTNSDKESRYCNRVVQIKKNHQDKRDLGDEQAIDIIAQEVARQRQDGGHIPIFLLSSDAGARKRLKNKFLHEKDAPPINALATEGIFNALERDGVRDENGRTSALLSLGLKGWGKDHWDHIMAQSQDIEKRYPKRYLNHDHDYQDVSLNTGDELPFAKAIQGLAAEMIKENNRPRQETQIEKFNRQKLERDRLQARGDGSSHNSP